MAVTCQLFFIDSCISHGEAPYLKSSNIADYLNKLDENVAIACPIGRIQYVSDFDQAAANRAEIKKMEKYIVDLENEQKHIFVVRKQIKRRKLKLERPVFKCILGPIAPSSNSAAQ